MKFKTKGAYAEIGSASGTQLDVNPTALVCIDAIKALLASGKPVEETIRDCRDFTRFVTVRQAKAPGAHKNGYYLGRILRWYYAEGETGTINYVQSGNKVPDTDGAKPCVDMPESFPDDVDYDWYIAKCKSILEEIGYLKRPKQLNFF